MKKFLVLMLAAFLCMNVISTARADEASTYSSNYFISYGTTLSHQGGGTLLITFSTTGMGICDQLGVASYNVEKATDEGWVNVSGLLNGYIAENTVDCTFGRYFYGVKGETYRVNVTFVSVKGGGMETKVYTSGIITAD